MSAFRSSFASLVLAVVLVVSVRAAADEPDTVALVRADPFAPIQTWIWHFDDSMAHETWPTYVDLLRRLPPDADVLVAVTSDRERRRCAALLQVDGRDDPRVRYLDVSGPVSPWARDRYLCFEREGKTTVVVPPPEAVSDHWHGDPGVGALLSSVRDDVLVLRSHLAFEGGDVLVGDDFVLIGRTSVLENAQRLGVSEQEVLHDAERLFDREVVLLGTPGIPLPHDHADMYLTLLAGRRSVLLGDPRLANEYFDAIADLGLREGPVREYGDFFRVVQLELLEQYDAVAQQLEDLGFRVTRIPVLHGQDDTVLTWTNALVERRGGALVAYVPAYGIGFLDRAAFAVWRRLGYEVRSVDCERTIVQGGGLRCLSNALRTPGGG